MTSQIPGGRSIQEVTESKVILLSLIVTGFLYTAKISAVKVILSSDEEIMTIRSELVSNLP